VQVLDHAKYKFAKTRIFGLFKSIKNVSEDRRLVFAAETLGVNAHLFPQELSVIECDATNLIAFCRFDKPHLFSAEAENAV
jgi:hypothetical protein